MENGNRPPLSFWIIAFLALAWNVVEIYLSTYELSFFEHHTTTSEFETLQSLPIWYLIVFMIALISETIGIFMLIIRKRIASNLFLLSVIALIFIELFWLINFKPQKVSIILSIFIPVIVIGIAIFLYYYSKIATKRGWLN